MGAPDDLIVRVGGRTWRFSPGEIVVVGREETCDIAVADPRVSRRHLRLTCPDGWVVEDLGSSGGVWSRGRRVTGLQVRGPVALSLADPHDGCLLELRPARPPARPAPSNPAVLTVGRGDGNDLVLPDARVSRRHARLERSGRGWRVCDLASRNGVLVNAVPVDGSAQVEDGDRITFGGTDLLLRDDDFVPLGTADADLVVAEAGYRLDGGKSLLSGVRLRARPGELVAVVGPSGAGKSTLLKIMTGRLRPTSGTVTYAGYDVVDDAALVRERIGLVPQDDLVHRTLTARQALAYSAMLRLPPDLTRAERDGLVTGVLCELDMLEHADTRIDRLSGGQRKRVSVAVELLTSPALLLLDEPTSGLDPALDAQLMATLRAIADAGRIVVVVTHNVTNLDRCDAVLVLAPGGVPVYTGPPGLLAGHFGTADWAEVFAAVTRMRPPEDLGESASPRRHRPVPAHRGVPRATWSNQVAVLCRRHFRLVVADRAYAAFLVALPFVLALMVLAVPGSAGLRNTGAADAAEAGQILVLIFVGAAFMGGAAGAREVVGELDVVLRERASGVIPSAYASAKGIVFGVVCAVQAALLAGVLVAVKPAPGAGALFPSGTVEIGVAVWATALASCVLALLGSALVRSTEQAMPVLVVTVMAQLVLCGGMVPVTGRVLLSQLSWIAPARWGYAAGASTVDLNRTSPPEAVDGLWAHDQQVWLGAATGLVAGAALFGWLLAVRMARTRRS